MERTILLVDDETHVIEAITRVLRKDGYRILVANMPAQALEILDNETVQVVLSDQRMPAMSGVELLSQVHERHPDTVRMVLSGYADFDAVIDAVNRGAVYKYLSKPWDNEALRVTVHEAFRHYELRQQKADLLREIELANQQLTVANRHLAEAALTDLLTGLPNRRSAMDQLEQVWSAATRSGSPLSVMMIDIDHFKRINDTYGHATGDFVLREVAHTLRASARREESVCRIGGEEFLVICPNTDLKVAMQAAERLRASLETKKIPVGQHEKAVTASIGVAVRKAETADIDALVSTADQAMYIAKESGRNQVCTLQSRAP